MWMLDSIPRMNSQYTYCQSLCICPRCSSPLRNATWQVLQVNGCDGGTFDEGVAWEIPIDGLLDMAVAIVAKPLRCNKMLTPQRHRCSVLGQIDPRRIDTINNVAAGKILDAQGVSALSTDVVFPWI